MKKALPCLLFVALVCVFYPAAYAQVGIGTDTPNTKAVLDLISPNNNQGFLAPRLAKTQREAMSLTAGDKGMLVFDTTDNKFYYWSGTAWVMVDNSSGSQVLSFASPNLSISGGNSINLSSINTDAQTLSFTPATGQLAITGGNAVIVTPAGTANGDLSGSYPNPIVDGLQNRPVANTAPTSGQVLKWDGSAWAPQADNAGTDAQTLTFTSPNLTISGGNSINLSAINTDAQTLAFTSPNLSISGGNSINLSTINTDAQTLTYTPATGQLAVTGGNAVIVTPAGVANGDLGGLYPNPIVDGLQNRPVANTAPTPGQVLKWDGNAWAPGTDVSGGGGLGGGGVTAQVAFWSSPTDVTSRSGFVFEEKGIRLGIGTNTPLGNLHVAGSQFVNHVEVTDNYSVKVNDYSLFVPDTSKPLSILLPAISSANVGRVLIIKSFNSQPVTLQGAVAPKDEIDMMGTTYDLYNNGESYRSVVLIGTQFSGQDRWIIISGTK